jgi:CSLREA domain-containing protein
MRRVLRFLATGMLVVAVCPVVVGSGSPALAGSAFVVDTTADSHDAVPGDGVCADSGGMCSLRAAAEEANALAGADVITVPAGTYTYTIAERIRFVDDVSLIGAGSAVTTVDADGLSGVFDVDYRSSPPTTDVTISGFTITGGNFYGAVHIEGGSLTIDKSVITGNTGPRGAGVFVDVFGSTVSIVDSVVRDNTATDDAGGGVWNGGTMTISGSTISGNAATSASVHTTGGGIINGGTLTLTDSTVSGNGADLGGGIYNRSSGSVSLVHSTVAFNSAGNPRGGAGIYNDGGSLTVTASLLDENWSPAIPSDCASTVAPTSGGYNFVGDAAGCMWVSGVGDVVGPDGGTSLVGFADLGPLGDNGGPTETHALSVGGAPYAVNKVPASVCTAEDQRGVTRPQGASCDKGAFEMTAPVAVDDTYATPADTPLNVPAPGVLANDVEGEGGSLSVWLTRSTGGPQPTDHGVVMVLTDGSFGYTPNTGFVGEDSFTYTVRDRTFVTIWINPANTDTATVTITVGDPNPQVGLVDPATGVWRLRNGAGVVSSFYYGVPGDYPFMGDWDCDGVDTPGLYRQSDGYAYLRNSNTQGVADRTFFFGDPGDVPLAGDFNNDGCDTLSIYRPSQARFYIINELGADGGGLGAADYSFLFGDAGDKPVAGDWDGDGVDEIGLHRETSGFFYYRNTLTTGIADGQFYFGDPGDRLVAGDWGIVDGADTPGLFRPSNITFYFRHTLTQGNADSQFTWTGAGMDWMPVSGDFTID